MKGQKGVVLQMINANKTALNSAESEAVLRVVYEFVSYLGSLWDCHLAKYLIIR